MPVQAVNFAVLPASAGMIRPRRSRDQPGARAPRIRGDDPFNFATNISYLLVLPASAGMILRSERLALVDPGAPRIRGDDPNLPQIIQGAVQCSPHPRG